MDDSNKNKVRFLDGILPFLKSTTGKLFALSLLISVCTFFFSKLYVVENLILTFYFFFSISAGALFILSLSYLTNAKWLLPLRSIFSNISSSGLLFLPILIPLLLTSLFFFMRDGNPTSNDSFPLVKISTLAVPSLAATLLFIWSTLRFRNLLALTLNSISAKPSILKHSIFTIFIIVFSITIFSFYFITSAKTKWFSGMFPLYHFTASVQVALACAFIIGIFVNNKEEITNPLSDIHFKNFGTLIFVFTLLHAYTSYFQYVIIYSANLPDELLWYKYRLNSPLNFIFWFIITCRLIIPFLVFLFNKLKTNHLIAALVCGLIIISHFFELLLNLFTPTNTTFNFIAISSAALVILNSAFFIAIYLDIVKNHSFHNQITSTLKESKGKRT